MSGIPRTGHRPARRRAGQAQPTAPPGPPATRTGQGMAADLGAVVGPLSFWRFAYIPFAARVAAPERWQLAGHDGQLRLGRSVVPGPAEHDQHFGTCRIEVRRPGGCCAR